MTLMSDIHKILPEEIINRLIMLSENLSVTAWEIGDLTNEIYKSCLANNLNYTQTDAVKFIWCYLDIDRSLASLIYYAKTAATFSLPIREKYAPLPFSHFHYAAAFDNPDEILDKSLDIMERNYGRPPSVRQLQQVLSGVEPSKIIIKPHEMIALPKRGLAEEEVSGLTEILNELLNKLKRVQSCNAGIARRVSQIILLSQEIIMDLRRESND